MAKESDSIIVIHIPCTLHLVHRNTDYYHTHPSPASRNPSHTRITNGMHKACTYRTIQRTGHIQHLYKGMGYNVYTPPSHTPSHTHTHTPSRAQVYMHTACRLYGEHMGYAQKCTQYLQYDEDIHDMCMYYQYNMQSRYLARDILTYAHTFQPDYLVLGADVQDVYGVVAGDVYDDRWAFECMPECVWDGMYIPTSFHTHTHTLPHTHTQDTVLAQRDDVSASDTFATTIHSQTAIHAHTHTQVIEHDEYGDDEDFLPTPNNNFTPVPAHTNNDEDSFILEDTEGLSVSFAPSSHIRQLQSAQDKNKRASHYKQFMDFSAVKTSLISMILHEMKNMQKWVVGHNDCVQNGFLREQLEREREREEIQARFSVILVNNGGTSEGTSAGSSVHVYVEEGLGSRM
ncbi:hypothetical protein EON63_15315 [archaeon]|nr:MAG: hypothetical protein EON63_15315 [archaeon]